MHYIYVFKKWLQRIKIMIMNNRLSNVRVRVHISNVEICKICKGGGEGWAGLCPQEASDSLETQFK